MWRVRAPALSFTLPCKPTLVRLPCVSTNNILRLCCQAGEIEVISLDSSKASKCQGEIKLRTVLSREAPWWKSTVTSGMQVFKKVEQVHATALLRHVDTMRINLWATSLESKL